MINFWDKVVEYLYKILIMSLTILAKRIWTQYMTDSSISYKSLKGIFCEYMATTFGIVWDNILNHSKSFYVTSGFATDVMHNFIEVYLQYELKEVMCHLIENKVFSLVKLKFNYSL